MALLARHPRAALGDLFSSAGGSSVPFGALHRSLGGRDGPAARPLDVDALLEGEPDVVFLATPNETSAELVPLLLDWDPDLRIVDLSGAFRLTSADDYPVWYGFAHPRPALLSEAVYGLTEWSGGALSGARLVANPGCYPTSVLLGSEADPLPARPRGAGRLRLQERRLGSGQEDRARLFVRRALRQSQGLRRGNAPPRARDAPAAAARRTTPPSSSCRTCFRRCAASSRRSMSRSRGP